MTLSEVPIRDLVTKCATWNPKKQGTGTFDYIDLSTVDKETKAILLPERVECGAAPSRARQLVAAGDVLVATVRPNLNGVAIVEESHDGATASTGYCVLRPKTQAVDARYLFHWVRTDEFVQRMIAVATGANYPAVSDSKVKASSIPLPPLAEQKRIAKILDAADALRAKRRESIALLDELLRSTFLDMFGDPVTNPKGWDKATVGHLVRIEGGWSPKCLKRPPAEDEWGVLKLGAVTYCEYRPEQSKSLPANLVPRPENEVRKGDVLFARKNTHQLVAACAYVHTTRPRLMFPDLIFRLTPSGASRLEPPFLWQQLIAPRMRARVQSLAGGAAGSMPNISKAKLRSVELVVPPPDMQKHFAKVVDMVEEQKAKHDAHLVELDTLFASLQSRAFRGDL